MKIAKKISLIVFVVALFSIFSESIFKNIKAFGEETIPEINEEEKKERIYQIYKF